jgi:hypothetical protein
MTLTPEFVTWNFYLIGIGLTLTYKLCRYIREGKAQNIPASKSAWNWFFDSSLDNVVSWGATILNFTGAFVLGAVYIDKLQIPGLTWLSAIPLHWAFALFLGSLTEFAIPNIAKTLANKISSMIGG